MISLRCDMPGSQGFRVPLVLDELRRSDSPRSGTLFPLAEFRPWVPSRWSSHGGRTVPRNVPGPCTSHRETLVRASRFARRPGRDRRPFSQMSSWTALNALRSAVCRSTMEFLAFGQGRHPARGWPRAADRFLARHQARMLRIGMDGSDIGAPSYTLGVKSRATSINIDHVEVPGLAVARNWLQNGIPLVVGSQKEGVTMYDLAQHSERNMRTGFRQLARRSCAWRAPGNFRVLLLFGQRALHISYCDFLRRRSSFNPAGRRRKF